MSIKYQTPNKQIRRIKQGDPDFILCDDWVQYPRAAVEITQDCPDHIAEVVREGFRKNYIKLTVAVYDHELMWEALSK
jgi:hypothetical protein